MSESDAKSIYFRNTVNRKPEPLEITYTPAPSGEVPMYAPVAPVPVPAKKTRSKRDCKPNYRQRSILGIDENLDLEAYSIELDKIELWRQDWPRPWTGPTPHDPHHQTYLAKGKYQKRLRSERYNTLKAAVLHGYSLI